MDQKLRKDMCPSYSMHMTPAKAILAMLCCACSAPELAPAGIRFVQGGVIVDGGIDAGGTLLTDGRELIVRDWTALETLEIKGRQGRAVGTAPKNPECSELFSVDMGSDAKATMAFAPGGDRLVITRTSGERFMVDGWRGVSMGMETSDHWAATKAQLPPRCQASAPVVLQAAALTDNPASFRSGGNVGKPTGSAASSAEPLPQ